MTVDELLLKLDAEYDRLESELPEHYLAYGRFKYSYPNDLGYHHDKHELDWKIKRQQDIKVVKLTIQREVERTTT